MKILVNGDWRDVNTNLLAPALQELGYRRRGVCHRRERHCRSVGRARTSSHSAKAIASKCLLRCREADREILWRRAAIAAHARHGAVSLACHPGGCDQSVSVRRL